MFRKKQASEESAMPEKPFVADTPDWGAFWKRKKEEFAKVRKAFKLNDGQLRRVEMILEHLIADERWQAWSKHPFKPTFSEAMAVALLFHENEFRLDGNKILKAYPIEAGKFIRLTRNVVKIMLRHDFGYKFEGNKLIDLKARK